MAAFLGMTFANERVELDGHQFTDCTFDRCTIVFSATAPVQLHGCRFLNCHWVFAGAAGLTIEFLRAVGRAGGQELIGGVLHLQTEGYASVGAAATTSVEKHLTPAQ